MIESSSSGKPTGIARRTQNDPIDQRLMRVMIGYSDRKRWMWNGWLSLLHILTWVHVDVKDDPGV